MKLAISNIAWEDKDEEAVFALLRQKGVTDIEVAPGRLLYGENAMTASLLDINRAKEYYAQVGITPIAMQSLHYGLDVSMFRGPSQGLGHEPGEDTGQEAGHNRYARQTRFIDATRAACQLANHFNIKLLVLGSPKSRIPAHNRTILKSMLEAAPILEKVASNADAYGACLLLEANSIDYGCRFGMTLESVIDIVETVGHKGLSFHLDLGERVMNEASLAVLQSSAHLCAQIRHVHISRPHLAPVGQADRVLEKLLWELSDVLPKGSYDGAVSIEMKPVKNDPIGGVERALDWVSERLR